MAFSHTLLKDEALSSAPPYNWSGLYAGINLASVKNIMNMTDVEATSFFSTIEQASRPQLSGGFQVGARHQLDSSPISGVYGLEFSANFANATSKNTYGSSFANYQLNSENRLNGLYLLEFIAGIAADKTFLFLAAGCSWTDLSGIVVDLNGLPFFHSFSLSNTSVGTVLGGGIEYAINERVSLRFKADVSSSNTYNTYSDTRDLYQVSNRTIQGAIGVNYRFG
jgi:opacity protein-like surface antigen